MLSLARSGEERRAITRTGLLPTVLRVGAVATVSPGTPVPLYRGWSMGGTCSSRDVFIRLESEGVCEETRLFRQGRLRKKRAL